MPFAELSWRRRAIPRGGAFTVFLWRRSSRRPDVNNPGALPGSFIAVASAPNNKPRLGTGGWMIVIPVFVPTQPRH